VEKWDGLNGRNRESGEGAKAKSVPIVGFIGSLI